jgi:hypothetical protein
VNILKYLLEIDSHRVKYSLKYVQKQSFLKDDLFNRFHCFSLITLKSLNETKNVSINPESLIVI